MSGSPRGVRQLWSSMQTSQLLPSSCILVALLSALFLECSQFLQCFWPFFSIPNFCGILHFTPCVALSSAFYLLALLRSVIFLCFENLSFQCYALFTPSGLVTLYFSYSPSNFVLAFSCTSAVIWGWGCFCGFFPRLPSGTWKSLSILRIW